MSMPALCTHKKQKHSLSYNPKDQKVNKIDEEANAIKFEKAKQKYIEFFNDENKISKFIDSTDNTDQKEKIKQSFNSDLVLNFVNKSSNYENIEQHPFYQQINKYWDLDQTKTEEKPFIQKIKNNYINKSTTEKGCSQKRRSWSKNKERTTSGFHSLHHQGRSRTQNGSYSHRLDRRRC